MGTISKGPVAVHLYVRIPLIGEAWQRDEHDLLWKARDGPIAQHHVSPVELLCKGDIGMR